MNEHSFNYQKVNQMNADFSGQWSVVSLLPVNLEFLRFKFQISDHCPLSTDHFLFGISLKN